MLQSYKIIMKINKAYTLLVVFCILFVTTIKAQHKTYRIQNGFGIMGGITQFDIITDNFNTKAETGWLFGGSATVDIPHKWYNISYAMQLSQNKISIAGRASDLAQTEDIAYNVFAAQVGLFMHIKTIGSHLTLDIGPMLQYNDRLILEDENKENYIIDNYALLRAEDISDISKFNIDGSVGLTAGFEFIKIRAQYIYGFTNILGKLNDKSLDTSGFSESKFKGNQSMLVFGAMITF